MDKVYNRIIWQNQPSTASALGATNLNKMDNAINTIDDRVVGMDTSKADASTVNNLVKSITYNETNGVITITKQNGTSTTIDTKLEKLAVNFTYNPTTQKLIITLDDKTTQEVDLSSLISQYEFANTGTIAFVLENGVVKANVINGSITADKLQPNYLADITVQAQTATAQANKSKRYAVGGVETGDTTDNAKYYKEQAELFKNQAKTYRDEAEDISGVGIATDSKLGLVKGNGNVEVRSDGAMWANPYKDKASLSSPFITCPTSDDALAHIKKIEGETVQVVTVQGINLFNGNFEQGHINASGGLMNDPLAIRTKDYVSVTSGAAYTKSNSLNIISGRIAFYNNGVFVSQIVDVNTFTVPFGVNQVKYSVYSNVNITPSSVTWAQLELGTVKTTYEPFSPNSPSPEYPSPLKYAKDFDLMTSGNNLFNLNATYNKGTDITNVVINGDTISVSSNNTVAYSTVNYPLDITLLRGKTVVFSYKSLTTTVGSIGAMCQLLISVSGSNIHTQASMNGNSVYVPLNATSGMIKILSNNLSVAPNTPSIITVSGLQLEFNEKRAYNDYKGVDKINISFPFMSVISGTKNGKEYINGIFSDAIRVKDIILNGAVGEGWAYRNEGNGNTTVSFSLPKVSHGCDTVLNSNDLYCSNFPINNGTTTDGIEGIAIGGSYEFFIEINRSRLTGYVTTMTNAEKVTLFKNWLALNNMHIIYKLATPIYTPIADIYLKQFKGTTHLFTNSDPQVTLTADFKSELWSRDYLQDVALEKVKGAITHSFDTIADLNQFKVIDKVQNLDHTVTLNVPSINGVPVDFAPVVNIGWSNIVFNQYILNGRGQTLVRGYVEWDNPQWKPWGKSITSNDLVQSDTVGGTDKAPSAEVTKALGLEIDAIRNINPSSTLTSAFLSGETILAFANSCTTNTSKMVISPNIPSDMPPQYPASEGFIEIIVGVGGRKTVRFSPYGGTKLGVCIRPIFNNAYLDIWKGLTQDTNIPVTPISGVNLGFRINVSNGIATLVVTLTSNIPNGSTVGVIPVGYRPTGQETAISIVKHPSGFGRAVCSVDGAGNIVISAMDINEAFTGTTFNLSWYI